MINRVTLVGNLGSDVELRYTPGGKAVTDLAVATSYGSGDKEETEWHTVTVWEKSAEAAAKFLKKGSRVFVEGRIKTDKYDKDGETRYRTKVVAMELKFLDRKEKAEGDLPF